MEKLGKKLKHDHTLTSILKFAIFSVIMLAPVFSVASRCLYVICNKNAKDSYSNNYVISTQKITAPNQMIEGNDYVARYTGVNGGNNLYGAWVVYKDISINWTNYNFADNDYNQFRLFSNGIIQLKDTNNNQYQQTSTWGNTLTQFTFNLSSISSESFINGGVEYIGQYYKQMALDNAFEYSLDQLQESNYYNWATNLGIYTPIYNMVHGLGGHDIIALLLAYWSIYTAIYIVFDIIIACFVKLTHLIQGE